MPVRVLGSLSVATRRTVDPCTARWPGPFGVWRPEVAMLGACSTPCGWVLLRHEQPRPGFPATDP